MRWPACAARSTRSRVPAAWSAPPTSPNSPGPSRICSTRSSRTRCSVPRPSSPPCATRRAIAGELVNALEAGQGAPAKAQDIVDRAHALAANTGRPERADRDHGNSRAHARYAPRRRRRRDRPRAHAAAAAGIARVGADAEQSPMPTASIEVVEDWSLDDQDQAAKNIVLSGAGGRAQRRPAAARHLQPRNAGEHRRGAALRRRRTHAQRAARRERRGLSRLPHAVRAARAWPRRATASVSPRRSNTGCASLSTAASVSKPPDLDLLADCMNAMQSVAAHLDESTGFLPVARRAAGAHRSGHRTTRTTHRRRRPRRGADGRASSRAVAGAPVPVAPAVAAPPASFPPVAATPPRTRSAGSRRGRRRADGFRPGHRQHLHR